MATKKNVVMWKDRSENRNGTAQTKVIELKAGAGVRARTRRLPFRMAMKKNILPHKRGLVITIESIIFLVFAIEFHFILLCVQNIISNSNKFGKYCHIFCGSITFAQRAPISKAMIHLRTHKIRPQYFPIFCNSMINSLSCFFSHVSFDQSALNRWLICFEFWLLWLLFFGWLHYVCPCTSGRIGFSFGSNFGLSANIFDSLSALLRSSSVGTFN